MDESEIRSAVEAVIDPLFLLPLGQLGVIDHLSTDDGVKVLVNVPIARTNLAREMQSRVESALTGLGISDPHVNVAVMTDDQLQELRERLRPAEPISLSSGPLTGGGHGDGNSRPSQFLDEHSDTRVLGITSGKGGVGKSSVTVNLALALRAMGKRVGILDADVYGFSVPKMLGANEDPVVVVDTIVPPVGHDVSCISIGFFVEEETPVMWRGPMLHKALEQFLVDVYWGPLDYLLIDMPPGTGDVAISLAQYIPTSEVYVVTTPQPAAQRVAQRSAQMAKKVNLPLIGVIENMSSFTAPDGSKLELFGAGGGQELATDLGIPLLAQIPLDPNLREGGDIGEPIVASDPEAEVSKEFAKLAEQIDSSGPRRVYKRELKLIQS